MLITLNYFIAIVKLDVKIIDARVNKKTICAILVVIMESFKLLKIYAFSNCSKFLTFLKYIETYYIGTEETKAIFEIKTSMSIIVCY